MQLTRFRVVILLLLAVTSSSLLAWHFASAITQPNSVVSPGSFINTSAYTIWNNAGTYQAKDDTGNPAVLTSSDIGTLTNNVIAACPTVTNAITARVVPECRIVYRDAPGCYSGTSPIVIYDDYYIALESENPSPTSVQNPATTNAVCIDIEAAAGVLRLLHNPNNNLGGGTIQIQGLSLKTSTTITLTSGIGAIFALGEGSTANPARVLLDHVGCYDLSLKNTCYALRSNSGDDLYYANDVFASGATNNFFIYIAVNHFEGHSFSITVSDVSAPGTNACALVVVPQGNFLLSDLHIFGTANAWLWVKYSGANPHLYAQFFNIFTELTASAKGAGIQGSYTSSFENPTTLSGFTWGATYNALNDTAVNISGGYLAVNAAVQYDQLGQITFPFATSVTSAHFVGPVIDKLATPTASTDYTVVGTPIYLKSTLTTITIKDFNGNTVYSPAAAISVPFYVPIGYKVNFGACAPCTGSTLFSMENGSN